MSARISVNSSEFENLLNTIEGRLDLRKSALGKKIADILRADIRRQFAIGGEPRWQSLSPRTIAQKLKMGYPRRNRFGKIPTAAMQRGVFGPQNILIRTLALFSSWTDETDPHHVETISADSVSVGSDLEYAGTHQYGYRGPLFGNPRILGVIPARPMTVTQTAREKIAAEIAKTE